MHHALVVTPDVVFVSFPGVHLYFHQVIIWFFGIIYALTAFDFISYALSTEILHYLTITEITDEMRLSIIFLRLASHAENTSSWYYRFANTFRIFPHVASFFFYLLDFVSWNENTFDSNYDFFPKIIAVSRIVFWLSIFLRAYLILWYSCPRRLYHNVLLSHPPNQIVYVYEIRLDASSSFFGVLIFQLWTESRCLLSINTIWSNDLSRWFLLSSYEFHDIIITFFFFFPKVIMICHVLSFISQIFSIHYHFLIFGIPPYLTEFQRDFEKFSHEEIRDAFSWYTLLHADSYHSFWFKNLCF